MKLLYLTLISSFLSFSAFADKLPCTVSWDLSYQPSYIMDLPAWQQSLAAIGCTYSDNGEISKYDISAVMDEDESTTDHDVVISTIPFAGPGEVFFGAKETFYVTINNRLAAQANVRDFPDHQLSEDAYPADREPGLLVPGRSEDSRFRRSLIQAMPKILQHIADAEKAEAAAVQAAPAVPAAPAAAHASTN